MARPRKKKPVRRRRREAKRLRRPETRAVKQAQRLTDMARTITSRHGVTMEELEKLYRTSRRTLYRDIDALEVQGYPIFRETRADGSVAFRMRAGFQSLPQIALGLAEVISLYVIRAQSHFLSGTNIRADTDNLFERLEKGMSERDQLHLRTFGRKFYPLPDAPKSYEAQMDLLDDLIDALIRQYRVEIAYRPPAGKSAATATRHRLQPYTLLTYKEGLYLIGYSETVKGIRTFAVERIQTLRPFQTSTFDYPEDYSPGAYFSGSFGIIGGEPQTVMIRFSPNVATYISERRYSPDQKLTKEPDGSVTLELRVAVTPDLVTWLLGFGPDAKVKEPAALAATVAERHRQAAEQYC